MRRKNLKRSIICLVLVIVMVTGLSINVFAGSGNVSYGGMTATWTISSASMTTNITNSTVATSIDASGYIYEQYGSTVKNKLAAGNAYSSKRLNFSSYPDNNYNFIRHDGNFMEVYINMSRVVTYKPQP